MATKLQEDAKRVAKQFREERQQKAQSRYMLVAAADRWAKANASDPFAKQVAMAYLERHKFNPPFTADGQPTYYDATEGTETRRLPDGTEYQGIVYHNLVRP